MQDPTFVLEPQTIEELYWFWGGVLTTIAAGGMALALMLRPPKTANTKKSNHHIASMLCFFIALSGAGAAIFSAAQLLRLKPLILDPTGFSIRGQHIDWVDIAEIRIEQSREKNALNIPTQNNRILVIKAVSGDYFFFAEKNYPLPEIVARIKSLKEKPLSDPQ